ncbi:MAG: type II toxin-antitoxin system death-on-curing family toxin [Anaerovoracaceae bacterium]|jgi:death-on-curing protein
MKRLSKEQIIFLHGELIASSGGACGIRDEGLLDSAVQAPFQSFDNQDLYPSLQQKAARLAFGLINNHPFIDGNKRIGAHAMLVFLALNGIEVTYEQFELSDLIIKVAVGELGEYDILQWIISHE